MKSLLTLRSERSGENRTARAGGLATAGLVFLSVGGALAVGAAAAGPVAHLDVICSGATVALAGMVLRGLASPPLHRD